MARNPLFSIIWIAVLFFLAWPIAGICAGVSLILPISHACLMMGRILHPKIRSYIILFPFCSLPRQIRCGLS
ncbi:hypothetical protein ACHAWX_001655 [Stephanocyclus meneghinianus]